MNKILVSSVFVLSAKCTVSTNEILWWNMKTKLLVAEPTPESKIHTRNHQIPTKLSLVWVRL